MLDVACVGCGLEDEFGFHVYDMIMVLGFVGKLEV